MTTHDARIAAIRRFSRLYTTRIGVLSEGILDSPYSLTEARVIYELGQGEVSTSTEIAQELDLDLGYVSRVVKAFVELGLVSKRRSEDDRRRILLTLSRKGRAAFEQLTSGSQAQISSLLSSLDTREQQKMVEAMHTIEGLLDLDRVRTPEVTLRAHGPGDMGWIVQRHGELYHASHGWNATFESMVADIAAKFLERYDPSCERSWIAEVDGRRAGSVVLTRSSKTVGRLRLLFVEPDARGLGIGRRLVSECVAHARHVGYRKMTLSTVSGLDAARKLYEREGFRLTGEVTSHVWGHDHRDQTWELDL